MVVPVTGPLGRRMGSVVWLRGDMDISEAEVGELDVWKEERLREPLAMGAAEDIIIDDEVVLALISGILGQSRVDEAVDRVEELLEEASIW